MTDTPLNPLCQQVLSFLSKDEFANKPVVLAYSGGVDSQVLLHCLTQIKEFLIAPVHAVHVNHGLSENATAWQEFTKQQAEQLGVPYVAVEVVINKQNQQSLEALARDVRYQAITDNSAINSIVLTAHHQDDQLETLLLALKRGSGIQGLSAMQDVRSFSGNRVIARPFLSISRKQIEQYADAFNLKWIEDESNINQEFDRNFLRQSVIPLLEQRWPQIKKTASRSAKHCQQAQVLVEQMAETDIKHCQTAADSLNIDLLKELSKQRLINVLRFFIKLNNKLAPSEKQIEEVIKTCFSAKEDKNPEVRVGNYYLRRFKQELFITEVFSDISAWQKQFTIAELLKEKVVSLPDNLGRLYFSSNNQHENSQKNRFFLAYSDGEEKLKVAFKHSNPKCFPDFRQQRRELKKVLQELNVPTWQRKRLPLIYINEQLAAVLPLFIDKDFTANTKKKCLSITWHKDK
ncbi:tRNA lysidine(34) synthetase TilS [Thalassotalea psychrophila]|uniref:tRNA(Ile)-lysidine synthase n=1 Tax=Thalassotalea psychrophila TaxID=3065647 RepID=A0ABY9U306_9GAMM|nr:tRNA lysidine(34) synthetase TilS [Colwelliaceae bacterium SQ149]